MGKSRRKHSREFKVEAVKQVVEQGRSISEVADGLGIHPSLLTRWKTELVAEGADALALDLRDVQGVPRAASTHEGAG